MTCGVYKISFSNTDKVYVGSSKDIEKRIKQHKDMLSRGNHHSYKLQEYYNEGSNKGLMEFSVLVETNPEDRIIAECKFIYDYKAIKEGFNVSVPDSMLVPSDPKYKMVYSIPYCYGIVDEFGESVSYSDTLLYSYLLYRSNEAKDEGFSYSENMESIAESSRMSYGAVRNSIRTLTKLGLINCRKKANQNIYEVLDKYRIYSKM